MNESQLKPARDFMKELGTGTRSYVLILTDHDGQSKIVCNDAPGDAANMFMFFLQTILSRTVKPIFQSSKEIQE